MDWDVKFKTTNVEASYLVALAYGLLAIWAGVAVFQSRNVGSILARVVSGIALA